jgi:hypothetical protein
MLTRDARGLRATRLLARLPRVVLIATCAVLALAGARTIFRGEQLTAATRPLAATASDLEAEALAERFVRTYLEWNGGDAAENLRGTAAGIEPPSVPASIRQHVLWTAASRRQRSGAAVVVTVTADTTRGLYHLAVPVGRRNGLLYIDHEPAFVGATPTMIPPQTPARREVEDRKLAAVARRVLTNFLARDRADLVADLDDAAVVVLPDQDARLLAIDRLDWAVPERRVSADVRARLAGHVEMPLRYELAVTRRAGRWLVLAINTNPAPEEVHP